MFKINNKDNRATKRSEICPEEIPSWYSNLGSV